MNTFPLPLYSRAEFQALFEASVPSGPSPLPVPSPTKPFWSHPGLSKDWPTSDEDPEGSKSTNPYAREGSEGPLTKQADVVIIGSGITGVSVALELARLAKTREGHTLTAVILEARDFCSGATARNGGHLTVSVLSNYTTLAKRHEQEEVKRCFELERHTVSTLLNLVQAHGWTDHIDLVEGGRSQWIVKEANVLLFSEKERQEAVKNYEKAREAGMVSEDQVKWLTPEETQKEYGAFYAMYRIAGHNLWPLKLVTKMFELVKNAEGSGLLRNFFSHSKGGEINQGPNLGWTAGQGDTLQKKGSSPGMGNQLESRPEEDIREEVVPGLVLPSDTTENRAFQLILHTHTPVYAVLPNQSNMNTKWSVQTPRGIISANRVIYATNGYTSHLLPHLSGPQGIVPVRGQVMAIRAKVGYMDEGDGRGISRSGWIGNESFEYWFPRPHPRKNELFPSGEPRRPLVILGDPEISAVLRGFLGNVFPGKFPRAQNMTDTQNEDGVEMEWSGIMGFTKSGGPFVGRVKDAEGKFMDGQYIVAGFTGHGMPRAYGCAQALASLVWSDIEGTPWIPPEWLPRHYLTEAF